MGYRAAWGTWCSARGVWCSAEAGMMWMGCPPRKAVVGWVEMSPAWPRDGPKDWARGDARWDREMGVR